MLPHGKPALVLTALLSGVAGAYVLGREGVRIGSFLCSEFHLGWVIGLIAVAFLMVSRRRSPLPRIRLTFLGASLLLLAWPLSSWRNELHASTPVLRLSVFRPSQPASPSEGTVSLSKLRLEGRNVLNRLVGRRRDVVLEGRLFLLVPHTGTYRFHLACDDICFVGIGDRPIRGPTSSAGAQVFLNDGIHPLFVRYEQRGGPAYLYLSWDRPGFFDFLPLEHYLAVQADLADPRATRAREGWSLLRIALSFLWWVLAISLALRAGESTPRAAGWVLGLELLGIHALVYYLKIDELSPGRIGTDDANIYFNYAIEFIAGKEFVWNAGGERVEGFTSLLWELACVVAFYCSSAPERVLGLANLGLLSLALSIWVAFVARRLPVAGDTSRVFRVAAVAWFFASPHFFIWNYCSLMETGLWTTVQLFAYIALVSFLSHPGSPSHRHWLSVALVGLLLTRPEGLAFGALVLAFAALVLWKRAERLFPALAFPLASFCLAVCLSYGARYIYFGHWFPNTFYAKVGPLERGQLDAGYLYVRSFVQAYPVGLVGFALALGRLGQFLGRVLAGPRPDRSLGRDLSTPAALLLLLGAALSVACGGDHMRGWRFLQPYWPCVQILVVEALVAAVAAAAARGHASRAFPRPQSLVSAGFLLVSFAVYSQNPVSWRDLSQKGPSSEFYLAQLGRQVGADLNLVFQDRNMPSVGAITVGGIAVAYRGKVIDLMGLNNLAMAHDSQDRVGDKNHAIFDRRVFYRQLPDLVLPIDPHCQTDHLEKKFRNLPIEYRVLKDLHRDAEFRELYRPAAVPSKLLGKTDMLCFFVKESFLSQRISPGEIVGLSYRDVGL